MSKHAAIMERCLGDKEVQHMLYSSKIEFT